MMADPAPTQSAPTPDRTAEPLDMACRAWKQPQAIAISQKFAFKIPLQIEGLSLDGQRPIDKARLSEERRQALGEIPSQRRKRRPDPPPLRHGGRLRQSRPGRRGETGAVGLGHTKLPPP